MLTDAQEKINFMYKPYNPIHIANNFIEKSIIDKKSLSPMKLQKLMYFMYRDYYKETNQPLFSERFEAWKYGPVLSSVYMAFKNYGSGDIKNYCKDNSGQLLKINEDFNEKFKLIINKIWTTYKDYSGIALSDITHRPGSAWHKSWMSSQLFLSDENILLETETSIE